MEKNVKVGKNFKPVRVNYHNTATNVLRWSNMALIEYGGGDCLVWYPVTEEMTTQEVIDAKGLTEILWNEEAKPSEIIDFIARHCDGIETVKSILDILAELSGGGRKW